MDNDMTTGGQHLQYLGGTGNQALEFTENCFTNWSTAPHYPTVCTPRSESWLSGLKKKSNTKVCVVVHQRITREMDSNTPTYESKSTLPGTCYPTDHSWSTSRWEQTDPVLQSFKLSTAIPQIIHISIYYAEPTVKYSVTLFCCHNSKLAPLL